LKRRDAINPAGNPFAGGRSSEHGDGEMPAWVGKGAVMCANWVVGIDCKPKEFADLLKDAPMDVLIITVTSRVQKGTSHIGCFLKLLTAPAPPEGWDGMQTPPDEGSDMALRASVLREKTMYGLSEWVFVACHRAKVTQCRWVAYTMHSAGTAVAADDVRPIDYGVLQINFDAARRRKEHLVIGVLDVRGSATTHMEIDELINWVVTERVALLTGSFGTNKQLVEEIACSANAIYMRPLFQGVDCSRGEDTGRSLALTHWSHPSYWLLFGYHKAITLVDPFTIMPDDYEIGEDILEEMVSIADLPEWRKNSEGNALIPSLGHIKTKKADMGRWIPHMFQTFIIFGTSRPSKQSILTQQTNREKGYPHREWFRDTRNRGDSFHDKNAQTKFRKYRFSK